MATLFFVPIAKKFLDHSKGENVTQKTSSSPKLTEWNGFASEPIVGNYRYLFKTNYNLSPQLPNDFPMQSKKFLNSIIAK